MRIVPLTAMRRRRQARGKKRVFMTPAETATFAALMAILLAGGSVALLKDTAYRLSRRVQPPDTEV